MASHQQPSPTTNIPTHHGPPPGHHQPNGHAHIPAQQKTIAQILREQNESIWIQMGTVSEMMGDSENALASYEHALRQNQWSVPAMNAISCLLRSKERFPQAVEYLQLILKVEPNNGEVWGSLGHCFLMMDELQQAYSAYQQALYHLQDPKEPKLWYGIGILYDRYGSLEHAEEAFSQVMTMEPNFEKANEIYFRLGIIYKQQQKYTQSLECFKYIVNDPPRPLTEEDIWFQIGHVYEQHKDYENAKHAYKRVLERDSKHAKVLQQLGWLHHQQSQSFQSQEQAIEYLELSVASDQTDAQSWYLLGRCYMSQAKYPKAYEAYQQAVYRDGRNPTFWCSIGVLYYQINQYRDALDAYSRAIRLNPNISEVWYDLGTLYESCNNQTADALDAYQRAADLDPSNVHIKARLQLLQNGQPTSGMPNQNSTPLPQDVHPQAYQPGAPPGPQWGAPAPSQPAPSAVPLGTGNDWNRRLAEIQNPGMPPQELNHYDQRNTIRPPPPQNQQRPPSPRQEPVRQFQEPPRPSQPPPRRGHSPSPKVHNAVPNHYQGPQGPPGHPSLPPQPPPQPQAQHQQQGPTRISNPNYGNLPTAANGPPPPPPNLGNGPPHSQGVLPPVYPRVSSPPPEVRPLVENSVSSPNSKYPHQPYQHHPNTATPGIERGAPPPAAAQVAADAAARDRDDRTPVAPKRLREWDEENSGQKPQNEDKRPRLDDPFIRRSSPAPKVQSPGRRSPLEAEARRLEEQRRANESYHPSDAAHHPHSLPSIHQAPPPPPQHHVPEPPKEERREQHEPAARKVDVDEDYDDSGEDEKRNGPSRSEKNSPRSATNGIVHGPQVAEQKV
ncbi:TPR-like protein [Patellaria atrata CBS 101060]|uniref:TPR-like protein n=1 Tax=Patellaria atrata CBS 101060 TaxID=1346257 RepID=A0A9P4VRQ9_9PEZI|nr:TPR-like protein [Patellaria atrata CBS 101060]